MCALTISAISITTKIDVKYSMVELHKSLYNIYVGPKLWFLYSCDYTYIYVYREVLDSGLPLLIYGFGAGVEIEWAQSSDPDIKV